MLPVSDCLCIYYPGEFSKWAILVCQMIKGYRCHSTDSYCPLYLTKLEHIPYHTGHFLKALGQKRYSAQKLKNATYNQANELDTTYNLLQGTARIHSGLRAVQTWMQIKGNRLVCCMFGVWSRGIINKEWEVLNYHCSSWTREECKLATIPAIIVPYSFFAPVASLSFSSSW